MTTATGTRHTGLGNSLLRQILQGILAVQYPTVDELRIELGQGQLRFIRIDEDGTEAPMDVGWLLSSEPRAESVRSILQQLEDRRGYRKEGLELRLEHLEPYPMPRGRH